MCTLAGYLMISWGSSPCFGFVMIDTVISKEEPLSFWEVHWNIYRWNKRCQICAPKELGGREDLPHWSSDLACTGITWRAYWNADAGLTSRDSNSILGGTQEFAFLASFQIMLMLFVGRDHTLRPTGREEARLAPQVILAPGWWGCEGLLYSL